MTIALNDARRIIEVIDKRVRELTKSMSRVETTWAVVASVADDHRTVAAYLYGETDSDYTSEDFRTVHGVIPEVGDSIKVAMDKERGERWVEEVHVSGDYNRLEMVPQAGSILLGDGTALPAIGSTGQLIRVNATADGLEYSDETTYTLPATVTFDTVNVDVAVAIDDAATFGFSDVTFSHTGTSEVTLDGALVMQSNLEVNGNITLVGGVINIDSEQVYSPSAGVVKTDSDFEAASLAIGTSKVSRWVPLVQTVVNTSRTSDLGTTAVEATALPATGVVAVTGYCTVASSTTGGDTITISHYSGGVAAQAQATGVANRDAACGFTCETGGTNSRQINYSVNWGSGTVSYSIVITGYWTTE